ncbi:MAG: hypothetical protein ABW185_27000 [Sedimenticola sp.]
MADAEYDPEVEFNLNKGGEQDGRDEDGRVQEVTAQPSDVSLLRGTPDRNIRETPDRGLRPTQDPSQEDRNRNSSISPMRNRSPVRHYGRPRYQDYLYRGNLTDVEPRFTHRPAHLQIKPESFDGTDDWDQYISHFQNCAELGRWSDPDKTLTLASCLKGQARSYYLALSATERSSYTGLVNKLTERFGSTRQQNRYLTKFETRSRRPGEDIASLGDDLRLMAQRAYPNLGPDAQETLALHQLYKVLPIEMKCRCLDRDCGSIASAVQIIERYEALLGDGSDKKRMTVRAIDDHFDHRQSAPFGNEARPHTRVDRGNPQGGDALHQVLDRLAKLESTPDRRNMGPRMQPYQSGGSTGRPKQTTRRCYACDSPDHFLRECPTYQKFLVDTRKSGPINKGSENSIPPSF